MRTKQENPALRKLKQEIEEWVGEKIRLLRIERSLRQKDVAKNAGISEPFMAQIESGTVSIHLGHAAAIACALDVDITDLFPPKKEKDAPSLSQIFLVVKGKNASLHFPSEALEVIGIEPEQQAAAPVQNGSEEPHLTVVRGPGERKAILRTLPKRVMG